ncbi:MAG: hypothetical protein IT303_17345 [Dehalococcoidia bacterium]|nr:hypothetical protein [Dehalococcoidia bacterium]
MPLGTHGDQVDWERITARKARLLALFADVQTEPECAAALGVAVTTIRSMTESLKDITGQRTVRDLGRWWRSARSEWLRHMATAAGIEDLSRSA